MSYLSTIKKLRLKTKWEEGTVDRRLTGPEAQWLLLIDCRGKNWIGLKSLNPPTVHYYRASSTMSGKMRAALTNLGATFEHDSGEYLVSAPLKKLPELCKIVNARKKRNPPSDETIEKLKKAGAEYRLKSDRPTAQCQQNDPGSTQNKK